MLLQAYKEGKLGYTKMPEDTNPWFSDKEQEVRLAYFTLPMALNYQRNSYTLRECALKTYQDTTTQDVFDIQKVSDMKEEILREKLIKYKLALQPNKHIHTRKTISETIAKNRWSRENLITFVEYDFLKLKNIIQKEYKKWFPYLSGPKIFNYRSFILQEYGDITLKNAEYIEIATDTHVTKCSVKLGVITATEAEELSKEAISTKRRTALKWSSITPIQMHPPLRFRSRNNFTFKI